MTNYKTDPVKYLSFLFGHEGKNSIISLLRHLGLATELISSNDNYHYMFTEFNI